MKVAFYNFSFLEDVGLEKNFKYEWYFLIFFTD